MDRNKATKSKYHPCDHRVPHYSQHTSPTTHSCDGQSRNRLLNVTSSHACVQARTPMPGHDTRPEPYTRRTMHASINAHGTFLNGSALRSCPPPAIFAPDAARWPPFAGESSPRATNQPTNQTFRFGSGENGGPAFQVQHLYHITKNCFKVHLRVGRSSESRFSGH